MSTDGYVRCVERTFEKKKSYVDDQGFVYDKKTRTIYAKVSENDESVLIPIEQILSAAAASAASRS